MRPVLILLLLITSTCVVHSQEVDEIVNELAADLKDNYILEDQALAMHDLLVKNLKDGNYDNLEEGPELADKLQMDLRTINNDKHLRIRYRTPGEVRNGPVPRHLKYPSGLGEAKILEGNIGYLEITRFPGVDREFKQAVAARIETLKDARAIVLDLRNNGGGSPGAVQLVCSYFLDSDIHLNTLYYRNRDHRTDFHTKKKIDGPRLTNIPLYILTSDYTFSGGEEFCYNLKHLKRATLVGEVTGGGAHPVSSFPMSRNMVAIIPVGMAINPITDSNWEGKGVEPHVLVDEDKALEKALSLIKKM